MTDAVGAALASWRLPPWPAAALALTALIYLRGWRTLAAQRRDHMAAARPAAFLAGLAAILVAVASPLDAFAGLLLQVHMLQHILLTMVAPPLLWLGAPALPLLRGLPPRLVRRGLAPLLTWPALRRLGRALAHPAAGWLAMVSTTAIWHLPGPYQLALRSPDWHELEHATFLLTGLWFWFPVVQPWPSRPRWPRWAMLPYLLLADLFNTALAALFTFAATPLYPTYAAAPPLTAGGALADQAMAGALMWVGGSAAYLGAVGVITVRWLSGARATAPPAPAARVRPARRAPLDLLRVRGLGAALTSLPLRRAVQALLLLLAVALVLDGFLGPQMSPMNLAGVLPWTYWRGLVVIGLLVAGNVFCFACPFMLPRELAKRLAPARRAWPAWLRGKWLALGLLIAYLWAYEAYDLWDLPQATAWLVIAYFAAAFAVDALFRGAAFCKHVCPIGQFHFAHAGAAPLTIAARDAAVCAGCATHDCLRGGPGGRGCELDLFVARKRDNLDCTLCLDCARACPHDNVGLLAVAPGRALPGARGAAAPRLDVAALMLVCVFAAFANAAGMLEPVLAAERALAARWQMGSTRPITTALVLLGVVIAPALAALGAAAAGRRFATPGASLRAVITRLAPALIPLGLGMWSAHFLFHFFAQIGTGIPVVQRVAVALGAAWLGRPAWGHDMGPRADWLTALELLLLGGGLVLSVALLWRAGLALAGGRPRPALALAAPWMLLAVALWSGGVWIVFQPMEMRGMVH